MKTILFLLLFALCAPRQALAEPYLTGTFSSDRVEADGHRSTPGSGIQLGAGYRFGKHVAAELSYFESSSRSDQERVGDTSTMRFWEASGFGVAVVGTAPVSKSVSLFAKLGDNYLDLRSRTLVTSGLETKLDQTVSRARWEPTISLGAEFAVVDRVALRAAITRVGGGSDRIDQASLGLAYYFK
jgi:hypothetical protein